VRRHDGGGQVKVQNAIKKVKSHFKKQGIDIEVELVGHRWTFVHNGYVGSFLANGRCTDEDQMDADAHNFHVRRANDHSDLMTDYHAGSFRDNITQVCHSLLPPPSKFKIGQLVRGKDSKRAIRQAFAGATGMVVAARKGGYVQVEWISKGAPKQQPNCRTSYSERDLILLS